MAVWPRFHRHSQKIYDQEFFFLTKTEKLFLFGLCFHLIVMENVLKSGW